jgi:hypothetical protein
MGVMIHAETTPIHHTRTVAVLVNEVKARNFATNAEIGVIAVPATIGALYSRGVISS